MPCACTQTSKWPQNNYTIYGAGPGGGQGGGVGKKWTLDVPPVKKKKQVTTADKTTLKLARPKLGLPYILSSCRGHFNLTESTCFTSLCSYTSAQCSYTTKTHDCAHHLPHHRWQRHPPRHMSRLGRWRDPSAFWKLKNVLGYETTVLSPTHGQLNSLTFNSLRQRIWLGGV